MLWVLLFLLLLPASASAEQSRIFLRQEEAPRERIVPVLVGPDGMRELGRNIPESLRSGDRVDKNLRLVERQRPSPTQGKRGLLFVSIGWPGAPPTPIEAAEYAGLPEWSEEASDGRWRWDPVSVETLQLPPQPACNDWAWARATRAKLGEMGYRVLRDYGALGIVVPEEVGDCVKTAYAYLGCQLSKQDMLCGLSVYSAEYTGAPTVVHELGHTLGLPHAQTAPCSDGLPLSYSGLCRSVEYGDRLDPMGTSFSTSMYNPAYSQYLQWISRNQALASAPLLGQRQEFVLSPYAGRNGQRALEIALPRSSLFGGASPGRVYAEYRDKVGIDTALWGSGCGRLMQDNNVFLRFRPSAYAADTLLLSSEESYFLDLRPETADVCDGGLRPGSAWRDPSGEVVVEFSTVAESGARVFVQSPAAATPSLRINGPRKKRLRGARGFSYQIRATNIVEDLERSDLYFKRGRCGINLWGTEPGDTFDNAYVNLYRCRRGAVQIAIKAGALRDEALLPLPGRDTLSPTVYLLPKRKKR